MEDITIGGGRRVHVGYGFDQLSLMPARRTRSAELVDISWNMDAFTFNLPVLGAPLDACMSPAIAAQLTSLGGLGVVNLEGLWTRYENPEPILKEIATLEEGSAATRRLQELHAEPIKEELIAQRVREMKEAGTAAGMFSPNNLMKYHETALDAGLDVLVVQGAVVTAQYVGAEGEEGLDLRDFTARYDIPVIVGGVVSQKSALHLMRTGAVAVMVGLGVGSGATNAVTLGTAVPQATAIAEVAQARSRYLAESGRYVHVIASGGIETGADVAKAIACGADAVALGLPLARTTEAPGQGAYWGLASAHPELPRGSYRHVEQLGSLEAILNGPAVVNDGTMNLMGALRRSMAVCGSEDLRHFQRTQLVVRP